MKAIYKETPQDIQDKIFSKMSADARVEVGAKLWELAKALVGEKINYGSKRPQTASRRNRKNS
ncbi:MAG: hypothetical protein HYW65_04380 [Candidatus Liptonbacteria bacterium]|nr:hypothetical protein [Candidatus Liptonbacteria bacterium]